VENSLSAYQELLGRLNRSKSNQRRGSDGGRSVSAREAEYQKSQSEYRANQDRYRSDFEIKGGFNPRNAYQQVVVGHHNPETGATWSAPNPGYTPKEGTGWVKGYGPKSDDTMPKINPPKDFLNSFLPKPGGVYNSVVTDYYNPETGDTYTSYNSGDLPPTGYVKGYKPKSDKPVSSPEEKTPTTSSKPALTKAMLNKMASF
tara:strand:+ start:809 stop:1414 length:606 start_codon:yes stop_codon:yes gene_type:complete